MARDLAGRRERTRPPVGHRRNGSLHLFSVRDGRRTIGGVVVSPWRGIAGVYDMGVRPEHRRQSLGQSLT